MPDLWEEGKPRTEDDENEERTADAGAGDWGNPGRWGTFGNRPSFHREEVWREET